MTPRDRHRHRDSPPRLREIFRIFGPFLRPHVGRFALAGVLVLAGTAASLLKPWPLKYLFDSVLLPDAGARGAVADAQLVLLGIVVALGLIALADSLLNFARAYVLTGLGETVSTTVRSHLYEHLQRLSLRYHERQRTGDLVTRVTSDVDKVQSIVTATVIETGASIVTLVGMLVVMFVLDWQLSLVMLLLFPVLMAVVQLFRHRIKRVEAAVRSSEGDLASIAAETLAAMRLVKAYGREDMEAQRFRHRAADNLGQELRVIRVTGGFSVALDMVTALALAGLVWLGAQRVLSGQLSPGDLIVFTAYLRDFISPTRSLSKLPAQLSRASVRAEKIAEVLGAQPDVVQREDAVPAPRLSGAIELRGVWFGYDPARPVLCGVDLAVHPGQTVAIVGATGAGKSTLVGLICRLYDPDRGGVFADGRDVRDYVLSSYQAQLAVVLQQTVLFRSSIRDNIAYGRPGASDEQIRAAARSAGADEFIEALPEGYGTMVAERGDTLSGGQRQRIALARAVLRDAPVLILDEPTTGLDARSERDVLAAIERTTAGRSTVIISHQLSAVIRADRIVVVDGGRVVEQGSHAELVAGDGRYAELARIQGLVPPRVSPSIASGLGVQMSAPKGSVSPVGAGTSAGDQPAWEVGGAALQAPAMIRPRGRLPQEDVDLSVLLPLLQDTYGLGQWRQWRRAPRGRSNVTYFVETERAGPVVLRRSHAAKTAADGQFEAALLDHLVARGYPAPPVVRTVTGDPLVEVGGVVHMAFRMLPGTPYDPGSPDHLTEAARGLAAFHNEVSGLPLRNLPRESPALATLGSVGRARLEGVIAACVAHLDATERERLTSAATYLEDEMVLLAAELDDVRGALPMHLLHGSYGRSALLFQEGRLSGVVDLDRAVYDLLAFDLAYALKAFCRTGADDPGYRVGMDAQRCRAFLLAYAQTSPLPSQHVAALPLVFRGQRLIKVVKKCDNLLAKQAVVAQQRKDALKLATVLEREEQRLRWLRTHRDDLVHALAG